MSQVDISIEDQLLEIIRELLAELGKHRAAGALTLHSPFERDLGLSSLDLVELLVRCETRFEIKLPDEIAEQAETPAGWARAIAEGGETVSKPGYRIVQPARDAPPPPDSANSLVEALRSHVEVEPDRVHIHLLENGSGRDITYGQLFQAASTVAAGLRAAGLRRNETVAIMLPTGADFFSAFFGVMLAGGVAIPIYPPTRPDKIEEYVRRQVRILRNAEIRLLITFDRVKAVSQLIRMHLPGPVDVTTVRALRQAGGRSSSVEPAEIALIQYTSGSTGDPKGVVLSHANVLANVRAIGQAVRVRPNDAVVSWLPLYSDMGLIGAWLFSLCYATPITVLSPLELLGRPESWLWALHDSRGTLSAAPNFAYEMCARKIPAWTLEGLDLSAWRVAVNAGEAVLPSTVARFTERFRPFGFRPEALLPCYGLAESSVALAFPSLDRLPVIDTIRREPFEKTGRAQPVIDGETDVLRYFSVGRPLAGHEVRLVDNRDRDVDERVQGRLLFRGPSKTASYYRLPEATPAGGWMDSGDLAYWAGGELYITGRRKDCMIIAGRNISPLDVETAAGEVPGIESGSVAAFGVLDPAAGTERLIVVAETAATRRPDLQRIEAQVIRGIDQAIGIPPQQVELIPLGSIPKTSNNKIRRGETRALYLQGKLRARSGPPWLQLLRLWRENFGPWARAKVRWAGGKLIRAFRWSLVCAASGWAGAWVRVTGSEAIVGPAARWLLRLSGSTVCTKQIESILGGPAVFVSNRSSHLDPLALLSVLPMPLSFAGAASLAGLPRALVFLLRPLLAGSVREALEEGGSILVLPDSPVCEPAHRSRYRLDAFRAVAQTAIPLYPVAIGPSQIRIGAAISPANDLHPFELRERVRGAIAALCQ